jgi:5-formyltetrahydrofolate cyclo-ligase
MQSSLVAPIALARSTRDASVQTAGVTEDPQVRKTTLRTAIVAARQQRSDADRAAAGDAIQQLAVARWEDVSSVAAYLSIGDEPPTRDLVIGLTSLGVTVLLPVIVGDRLDWAAYSGPADLASGSLGITEPTGARLGSAVLNATAAILVPALAVDHHGNRLGRGRGFYDRALTAATAPIVAVVYDDELIADVPVEPHDRPVGEVLQPGGFTLIS